MGVFHWAFIMKLLAFLLALATVAYGHDKIVGCYWGVWSFYRPGYGAFDVDDIDASLCTHGMYGFADLDNATWTIKVWDPWYDQAPEDCGPDGSIYCHYDSYRRFINLKQSYPNFKPMISIGGWNAGSGSYSMMAADPQKRKTFIDSLSEFLDKYHFDGVDLDWEYPGDREGSDPENDKENFSKLVTEMKAMLSAKGKLFTAALTPDFRRLDIGYDVPVVSEALDVMFIMTYDYHGLWDNHNFTGHNAPIYFRDEENFEEHPGYKWNVYDTLTSGWIGELQKTNWSWVYQLMEEVSLWMILPKMVCIAQPMKVFQLVHTPGKKLSGDIKKFYKLKTMIP